MSLVRRLARPMLAAQFVWGGVDQLRRPDIKADNGGPIIPALAGAELGPITLPTDPEALVRVNGAVMTGAGSLLALGKLPRLSALALAASLVPTTLTGHRFWDAPDEKTRQLQIVQVLKNVGLLGGLLIAAVDTDGKPGLGWRARRAARDAKRTAALTAVDAKRTKGRLKRDAELALRRGKDAVAA
jgi:uncharacterized membrane protein YphA (DoxX/SURF4 family)